MKGKSVGNYLVYSFLGLLILITGAVLSKLTRDAQGIMMTLPYVLIGIGAGIFGQNVGTVFNIRVMKKSPQLARQKEIDEKDERNTVIRDKAKAKAYDLMVMVFGALMFGFALMDVELAVVLAFVFAYLFIVFSNIYYINKYSKEM